MSPYPGATFGWRHNANPMDSVLAYKQSVLLEGIKLKCNDDLSPVGEGAILDVYMLETRYPDLMREAVQPLINAGAVFERTPDPRSYAFERQTSDAATMRYRDRELSVRIGFKVPEAGVCNDEFVMFMLLQRLREDLHVTGQTELRQRPGCFPKTTSVIVDRNHISDMRLVFGLVDDLGVDFQIVPHAQFDDIAFVRAFFWGP